MKIVSVCCVLLTITISASCLQKDSKYQQISDRRSSKRIIKRDASLLVDTSPVDIDPVYNLHPVISFRRISRTRVATRPRQSPRLHKSAKKYKKPSKPKYNTHGSNKKNANKSKYYRKRPVSKNNNYSGAPKYTPQYSLYQAEPAGFGEPPSDLVSYSKNEYQRPIPPSYREEITDSYGKPIKPTNLDTYPPSIHPIQYNNEPDINSGPGQNSWQSYDHPNADNYHAYSKKRPVYEIPDLHEPQEVDNEKLNYYYYRSQSKPAFNVEQNKYVRMPWKVKSKRPKDEDEIIVGGQYAEPPARYVPKFQPSAPMYDNEEDFNPPHRLIDPEVAASATISPYVNYKHSNMAFSPQNLNDAFSIVEV